MVNNIYAVYDRLAGIYSKPFTLDAKTASRTFHYMAKEYAEADCKDREIHLIGAYDNENGNISGQQPVKVYDLEEAKKNV